MGGAQEPTEEICILGEDGGTKCGRDAEGEQFEVQREQGKEGREQGKKVREQGKEGREQGKEGREQGKEDASKAKRDASKAKREAWMLWWACDERWASRSRRRLWTPRLEARGSWL